MGLVALYSGFKSYLINCLNIFYYYSIKNVKEPPFEQAY